MPFKFRFRSGSRCVNRVGGVRVQAEFPAGLRSNCVQGRIIRQCYQSFYDKSLFRYYYIAGPPPGVLLAVLVFGAGIRGNQTSPLMRLPGCS